VTEAPNGPRHGPVDVFRCGSVFAAVSAGRRPMESEIRNRPSFANVLVKLERGDQLVAESDAMASMSASIELKTRWNGGFFQALLRRLFGSE
jgi:hypothetical protein